MTSLLRHPLARPSADAEGHPLPHPSRVFPTWAVRDGRRETSGWGGGGGGGPIARFRGDHHAAFSSSPAISSPMRSTLASATGTSAIMRRGHHRDPVGHGEISSRSSLISRTAPPRRETRGTRRGRTLWRRHPCRGSVGRRAESSGPARVSRASSAFCRLPPDNVPVRASGPEVRISKRTICSAAKRRISAAVEHAPPAERPHAYERQRHRFRQRHGADHAGSQPILRHPPDGKRLHALRRRAATISPDTSMRPASGASTPAMRSASCAGRCPIRRRCRRSLPPAA